MSSIQPVIILGMHRSGTSLLTSLLAQWGLFIGENVEQNHEAIPFLKLNEWMFYQANASWDRPENMNFVDDQLWSMMGKSVNHLLSASCKDQFLGEVKTDQYKSLSEIDFPWGWKDPRTIFTMPVWLKLFPSARLIHITRHPVDVANSIANREQRRFAQIEALVKNTGVNSVVEQGQKFRTTVRGQNIKEGINLWLSYVGKAKQVIDTGNLEVLSIQYEDLLRSPVDVAHQIADHVGLSPSEQLLEESLEGIDTGRRYAFRKSEKLLRLYKEICDHPLVQEMGYADVLPAKID